jgi:small subunit ribosomal protein S15
MDRSQKKKIMAKHGKHETDTGSSQVQVAILTERIEELSAHLKNHKKDNHARRGLLGLVSKRRRHLNYLKFNDNAAYLKTVEALSLKK